MEPRSAPEKIAEKFVYDYLDELHRHFHNVKWDMIEYLLANLGVSSEYFRGELSGGINAYDAVCEEIRRKQDFIMLPVDEGQL